MVGGARLYGSDRIEVLQRRWQLWDADSAGTPTVRIRRAESTYAPRRRRSSAILSARSILTSKASDTWRFLARTCRSCNAWQPQRHGLRWALDTRIETERHTFG